MAAASFFLRKDLIAKPWLKLAKQHPEDCAKRAASLLSAPSGTYWDHRLSLGGAKQKRAAALAGETRINAIVNNVFIPFLAAQDAKAPFRKGLLNQMPVEADNTIVRQTAVSLFGSDVPPSLCRGGLRQQGLIQIFHDFCLNDRSRCAACELPGMLRRHANP